MIFMIKQGSLCPIEKYKLSILNTGRLKEKKRKNQQTNGQSELQSRCSMVIQKIIRQNMIKIRK